MSRKLLCGNVPLWLASHFLYLYLPGPEEFPRTRERIVTPISWTSIKQNWSFEGIFLAIKKLKTLLMYCYWFQTILFKNNLKSHVVWQSLLPESLIPAMTALASWQFLITVYTGNFFLISDLWGKLTDLNEEVFRKKIAC